MKIGDTREVSGFTIKAVAAQQGCIGCHLVTTTEGYNLSQRVEMTIMCNTMPVTCKDQPLIYKIVGVE